MSTILLTGYPGFLGSALLPLALARRPWATAVCLVQDRYLAAAEARLAVQTQQNPDIAGRVRLVEGDITVPGLGLDEAELDDVREVFHLAAVYDLAVGAAMARKVNVDGTRNVLDVCEQMPNLTRLQYVSTCYVSGRFPGVFREDDLDVGQVHQNFYEETKFGAEVLVRERMVAGLPATIYRPGIVVGDSRTGETQKFDGPYYVAHLLKLQPKQAAVPRIGDPDKVVFSMVPRDFVISGLDELSDMDKSLGKTYQLTDPNPPTVRDMVTTFAALLDRKVTWVPIPLRVGQAVVGLPGVERLIGVPEETLDYMAFPTRYDTSNVSADLEGTGLVCPSFAEYAPNLISYFVEHPEISPEAMV